MTDINIKYLERYSAEIEKLEILNRELEWLYYPVSSPNGKEMSGGGGSSSSPTESALKKIEKVIQKINEQKQVISEYVEEVNAWLNDLEDKELVSIIRYHYMDRLTWRETCKKVYGYSDRQVCRKRVMRYFGKEK